MCEASHCLKLLLYFCVFSFDLIARSELHPHLDARYQMRDFAPSVPMCLEPYPFEFKENMETSRLSSIAPLGTRHGGVSSHTAARERERGEAFLCSLKLERYMSLFMDSLDWCFDLGNGLLGFRWDPFD